ncbi:hypothetical protein SEA_BARB_83 [Gordonia phage Barb]|uniref:Uncharacterized protein n=1 Tax=Gordonia phage Barb TaxID=2588128 RepID=A0A4Y5TZ90_9CAUD|nr:hypothetical protein KNU55_gp83 [Gordonia phage Barb]QDB74759.1 hypothetical protein SEA_BARB_83 [Gordonia phage Barb]QXO14462.1 hypothetical protein SEA_FUGAX_84 [Gordonia phage Fugax]WNM73197.1 hypothetical protein SEA_CLAMCHOWDER_83 [Gordonia phage ClamChowder]
MTAPKRYRKKPVEIEAMQWDGTAEGATPIINWVLENDGTATFVGVGEPHSGRGTRFLEEHHPEPLEYGGYGHRQVLNSDAPAFISIRTLEGYMRADASDWIIRGVQREFYPCKPDIFAETYDDPEDVDPLLAVRRAEQRLVEAREALARANEAPKT